MGLHPKGPNNIYFHSAQLQVKNYEQEKMEFAYTSSRQAWVMQNKEGSSFIA